MSTWNAAIVSAPSSTNMPAMHRNVRAMSSAAAVIRLIRTTAAPDAMTPIDRMAKTTGSMKSKVTAPLARRAHRQRGTPGALPQAGEAPPLQERQPGDEGDEEHPAADRDRHARVWERERQ